MEFLIRRVDGDLLELPPEATGCEVFQPPNLQTSLVDGFDVCAVQFETAVLTFSMEMPGLQISVGRGGLEETEAERFVEALRKHLETKTGQDLEIIRFA